MASIDSISELREDVALKKKYPRAFRSVLRRIVPWLIVYIGIVCIFFIIDSVCLSSPPLSPEESAITSAAVFRALFAVILRTGLIVCVLKAIYELLYYLTYYYAIEAGHIVISKGVILKSRGSIPFNKISDISLERKLLDFVFVLYNIRFLTMTNTPQISGISGLSTNTAVALQDYLVKISLETEPKLKEASLKVEPVVPHLG